MKKLLWGASFVASALLLAASVFHWVGLDIWEVVGFITGGYCVWLAVVENIWNWPIGIANAVAFGWLFTTSRLYADAGLQAMYFVLGFVGWYWWLKGGKHRSALKVSRISLKEVAILAALGVVATYYFTRFLTSIGDVAPFFDGLTTVSSLIAQYMLTRKYFENWHVWIATDVIYIGLYGFKHLYLTSILYVLFLSMCLVGVRDWKKQLPAARPATKTLEEAEV